MGTYLLSLRLDKPQTIAVGRYGEFVFPAGWHFYAGSARGPGGLRARLARHRRRLAGGKRAHWHVDYLREAATWGEAWARATDQRLECAWAAELRTLPGARVIAPGFGASDCRCPAHLVHVATLPDDDWFAQTLGAERMDVERRELDSLLFELKMGSEESREGAALAIGSLGAEALEPLLTLLATGDEGDRWWAARALAEVGDKEAVQPLVSVLADVDPDLRACAALSLGRIGDAQAAPALAARLADESAFVAGIAADALSMIGENAVKALTAVLDGDNPHVRLLAVKALGRMRTQRAIGPLFGVLEDPSYLVRYYAREALEALGVGLVFIKP